MINNIMSDNRREFKNTQIEEFCDDTGIKNEFSSTHTLQQNGGVERKNNTLITLARAMLDECGMLEKFWAIRASHCEKTQYILLLGVRV
jgi:transposase InsO family protein